MTDEPNLDWELPTVVAPPGHQEMKAYFRPIVDSIFRAVPLTPAGLKIILAKCTPEQLESLGVATLTCCCEEYWPNQGHPPDCPKTLGAENKQLREKLAAAERERDEVIRNYVGGYRADNAAGAAEPTPLGGVAAAARDATLLAVAEACEASVREPSKLSYDASVALLALAEELRGMAKS